MVKKVYLVENLDCANCASKVEAALNALPEVQEAVLTYATMQLRITAEDPDALLPKLQEAAQKVEPEVEFYPRDGAPTTATPASMSIIMIAAAVTSIITTTITNMSIATTTLMTIITMMTMSMNTNTITTMNIPTSTAMTTVTSMAARSRKT